MPYYYKAERRLIFYNQSKVGMQKQGFLGIDVSKGYADFVLMDRDCRSIEETFQLSDTTHSRKHLMDLIAGWQKQGLKQLYCAVESTGGYENNWYCLLKGLQAAGGVWVARLNAKAIKSASEASLRRTVTDAVSAASIASFMVKFPEKVDYGLEVFPISEQFKEGRQFITGISMWQKQKVQLSNQLEKLLYQHLSELLIYCRNGMQTWMLEMLIKYPSIAQLKKAGVAGLSKIKSVSKEKAQAILKKISESNPSTSKSMQYLISTTAREVLHQRTLVETNKAYLNEMYKDDPSVELLTQIKGIGLDSAVSIVLEIEDVKRFASAKKIVAYFGLDPTFKQSGDGLWGNHLSKKGRGRMRSTLYMVALSAVRYNPMFTQLYARFRAKGMKHKQAAGVVMNKMLRVIYGVLKTGKAFDPQIDKKQQENAVQKQDTLKKQDQKDKRIAEEKRQRFQSELNSAPISGRNYKKRKKQLASQSSVEANTGSPTAITKI